MALFTKQDALDYHSSPKSGKLAVVPTKPCKTQLDLSLAYSPGVAEACNAIVVNKEDAYSYTNKGNLVAVISNGTAVLGLGNIGPDAGKPVMEGKGVLFKVFADIDVYDLNINESNPDKFCEIVKSLEPTFGAVNLEDIKAPECFYIEERLKKEMGIPVFHDDQHGTAIISGAGLLNAIEIANKKIEEVRVVVNGAGAAAIACAKFYIELGVKKDNIAMFDSKGHINKNRSDLTKEKEFFATSKAYSSLAEAMVGADAFLGVSKANVLSQDMVKSMASHPIIFACANPNPEITYPEAKEARADAIVGTGRSDFPNQVNNVSGFPYIFRGALDVRATEINEAMKVAAAKAIAALAKEPVPTEVSAAYGGESFTFGIDYIIPKPLDSRLITYVASAVAEAAIATGVAKNPCDISEYKKHLVTRMNQSKKVLEAVITIK